MSIFFTNYYHHSSWVSFCHGGVSLNKIGRSPGIFLFCVSFSFLKLFTEGQHTTLIAVEYRKAMKGYCAKMARDS